jgi:hypothetical protein
MRGLRLSTTLDQAAAFTTRMVTPRMMALVMKKILMTLTSQNN